jgi:hypothetical protein
MGDGCAEAEIGSVEVSRATREPVGRSLAALDWSRQLGACRRLAGVASDADVFLLEIGAQRVVLKVTHGRSDDRWRPRARRELLLYTEVADDLGLSVPAVLATQSDDAVFPGWTKRRPWPSSIDVGHAIEKWSALGYRTLAHRAAAVLPVARASVNDLLPTALIHGDCNVGNLLLSGGQIVRADWQEISLGAGPEDLALLLQRAEFDGARPPRAAMLDAYSTARGIPGNADLGRALAAAELRLLLVDWPKYVPYGTADRQQTMVQRLQHLVEEWP